MTTAGSPGPQPEPRAAAGPAAGDTTGADAVPMAARGRLASVAAGRARSSLESVAGGVGLDLAGFDYLTEVMGCVVVHLGWSWYSCGAYGFGAGGFGSLQSAYANGPTLVTGRDNGGFAPYGKAVRDAWDTSLERLLREAADVGADGVIGIRATRRRVPGSVSDDEFVLLGTAVRSRGSVRPRRPFATDLGGDRFAVLLRSGWVPSGYAILVTLGVRHDDWQTMQASTMWAGNQEVPGYTQLVNETRNGARDQLTRRLRQLGGDAAIASDMAMRVWEVEPGENHRDHVCEVTISGTALAAFDRTAHPPGPRPLTVMPLTDSTRLSGRPR